MNFDRLLHEREAAGTPIRVALIGAGKLGSMFLVQVPRTPGLHMAGIADLDPARAQAAFARIGWASEVSAARSIDEVMWHRTTIVTDDATALITADRVKVVIDATGSPVCWSDVEVVDNDTVGFRREMDAAFG